MAETKTEPNFNTKTVPMSVGTLFAAVSYEALAVRRGSVPKSPELYLPIFFEKIWFLM